MGTLLKISCVLTVGVIATSTAGYRAIIQPSKNQSFIRTAYATGPSLPLFHNKATVEPTKQDQNIFETAVSAKKFSTLVVAAKAAGLVDTLTGNGPLTVLAPTDTAFEKLPKGTVEDLLKPKNRKRLIQILKYHIVPREVLSAEVPTLSSLKSIEGSDIKVTLRKGNVLVDTAKLVQTDVRCSNGVIHYIDSVILPPVKTVTVEPVVMPNIIDRATAAENFNTFIAAVKAADLVDALKGDGPFTVFAPNDMAFKELPDGTLESLLKPENKARLTKLLTYHVLPGKVMKADLMKLGELETLQGKKIRISVLNKVVKVDDARVVNSDVECGNGVIHVIDSVVTPK